MRRILPPLFFLIFCAVFTSCNSGGRAEAPGESPGSVITTQLNQAPGAEEPAAPEVNSGSESAPGAPITLNAGFSVPAGSPEKLLVLRETGKGRTSSPQVEPEDFSFGTIFTSARSSSSLLEKDLHPLLKRVMEELRENKTDKTLLGPQASVILRAQLPDILTKIDAFSAPRYFANSRLGENEALLSLIWWSPERELPMQVYIEKTDKAWKIDDIIVDVGGRGAQSSLNYNDYSPKEIDRTLKKEGIIR